MASLNFVREKSASYLGHVVVAKHFSPPTWPGYEATLYTATCRSLLRLLVCNKPATNPKLPTTAITIYVHKK